MSADLLTNASFLLILITLIRRDLLWLRITLTVGHLLLVAFTFFAGNQPLLFWNSVFTALNLIQIGRLIKEQQPIHLSPDLAELHEKVFSPLTRREFLYFWETGVERHQEGGFLIHEGEKQKNLVLVLSGTVRVEKNDAIIAHLSRGRFVADMSFLTGDTAQATVKAEGKVVLMTWSQEKLKTLRELNSGLFAKFQGICAKDLALKVKEANIRS